MTERKHFKRIVRTRMAKTGESYSTAHRQISATGRSLPPGVIDGYLEFGFDRHRESALARQLLAPAGIQLSEPMACGLGGGIGFLYAIFEYANLPHPLLTIVAQHHPQPWADAVLTHLGVPYREYHSGAAPAALVKLRRELAAGRPVLCTVDRSGLPWHPDVNPLSAADPYPVVVAGIDGDTLYVSDVDSTPHEITAEQFGRAWSGHRKGRHHMLVIEPGPGPVDLPASVRRALDTTVAHLTGPVLGNSFDVNLGLSGQAKMIGEMREPRRRTGWARRFASPEGFDHVLGRIDECLQREYTAPDGTRGIYADFLEEAAALVPDRPLSATAGMIRRSAQSWAEVTRRCRQARAQGDTNAPGQLRLFEELADLVQLSADSEIQAAAALQAPTSR